MGKRSRPPQVSALLGIILIVELGFAPACIRFTRAAALEQPAYVLETYLLSAEMKVQNDWAEPAEEKTAFKKGTDKNVFSFIRLKDMLGEHKILWKWYDPSGKLYRMTDAISIGKADQMFEKYIAWDQIYLFQEKDNGTWTVAVFLDDRLLASREFTIQ
jgi:hypothetical protein